MWTYIDRSNTSDRQLTKLTKRKVCKYLCRWLSSGEDASQNIYAMYQSNLYCKKVWFFISFSFLKGISRFLLSLLCIRVIILYIFLSFFLLSVEWNSKSKAMKMLTWLDVVVVYPFFRHLSRKLNWTRFVQWLGLDFFILFLSFKHAIVFPFCYGISFVLCVVLAFHFDSKIDCVCMSCQ